MKQVIELTIVVGKDKPINNIMNVEVVKVVRFIKNDNDRINIVIVKDVNNIIVEDDKVKIIEDLELVIKLKVILDVLVVVNVNFNVVLFRAMVLW